MTIIEMYGLPGAGKTTIANELEKLIKTLGLKTLNTDDFIRTSHSYVDIVFSLFYPGVIKFLILCIRVLVRKHLIFKHNTVKCILRTIPYFRFYTINKKNTDFFIMDQAVVQSYITTFFNHTNLDEDDYKDVFFILDRYNIKTVFFDISSEKSNNRINKRAQTNHGRIDSMTNECERVNNLKIIESNCLTAHRTLANMFGDYRIDCNLKDEELQRNSKKIAQDILDYTR